MHQWKTNIKKLKPANPSAGMKAKLQRRTHQEGKRCLERGLSLTTKGLDRKHATVGRRGERGRTARPAAAGSTLVSKMATMQGNGAGSAYNERIPSQNTNSHFI